MPFVHLCHRLQLSFISTCPQDFNGAIRKVTSTKDANSVADKEQELAAMLCSLENKDACLMCGS